MEGLIQTSGLYRGLLLVYPMKTCVIGARGFIGSHFYAYYKQHDPFLIATDYRFIHGLARMNLDSPILPSELSSDYSHVFIAAGVGNPQKCEADPKKTFQCNVEAPLMLAKECLKKGLMPVFLSTDYVFDGKEAPYRVSDAPSPLNEYGRQKAELEKRALDLCKENCLIIRLSKVYGLDPEDNTLISEMIQTLRKKQTLLAATDQVFAPICIKDVISGFERLKNEKATGIFHFAGPRSLSRFELAKLIAQKIGADEDLVKPISLECLQDSVKRPKNTTLVSEIGKITVEEAIAGMA